MTKEEINFDELNPRVRLELGATIGIGDYQFIKPLVGIEIDLPPGRTVEETLQDMTVYVLDQLEHQVAEMLGFVEEITE